MLRINGEAGLDEFIWMPHLASVSEDKDQDVRARGGRGRDVIGGFRLAKHLVGGYRYPNRCPPGLFRMTTS